MKRNIFSILSRPRYGTTPSHEKKCRPIRVKPGTDQTVHQVIPFEISGHEGQGIRRRNPQPCNMPAFPVLHGGPVHLEHDKAVLSMRAAQTKRIEAGPQHNGLQHATPHGCRQSVFRNAASNGHEETEVFLARRVFLHTRLCTVPARDQDRERISEDRSPFQQLMPCPMPGDTPCGYAWTLHIRIDLQPCCTRSKPSTLQAVRSIHIS